MMALKYNYLAKHYIKHDVLWRAKKYPKKKVILFVLETKCVAITYTFCLKGDPQYTTYE